MPSPNVADFCIYTMRRSQKLERDLGTGTGDFVENKSWKTGSKLLGEARNLGQRLPILFSAADQQADVRYWGLVDDIELIERGGRRPDQTRCWFTDLRRIEPARPVSALTLRDQGRPLSDSFIRPYAICRTPSFLTQP